MTTLSFSAGVSLGRKGSITLSANHLLTFVLSCESSEVWLNFNRSHTTASKSENEMEGRLFLNIVIRKGTTVFELFTSEDESLLIWGDALLILDFSSD